MDTRFQDPRHILRFLDWCRQRGVASIGSQLLGALQASAEPYLLGGPLRFLARRETQSVLESWADGGSRLAVRLARLAAHLSVDFPAIRAPSADQRMDDVLHGHLSTGYLAACLGTRRAPGLQATEHAGLCELRVWLLIKSLEYSAAGDVHDASLRDLAVHLRHGLDGQDADKLHWFVKTVVPKGARGPFELELKRQATADPKAADWQKKTVGAIHALLVDKRRPLTGLYVEDVHRRLPEDEAEEAPTAPDVRWTEEDPVVFHNSRDAEDDAEQEFTPDPDEAITPAQAGMVARGISLLGLEDRQFLPFAWNRPRADERTVLMHAVSQALTSADTQLRLISALVHLCLLTRSSLRQVMRLQIGTQTSSDWRLHVGAGQLLRESSRRAVRWRADDASAGWIRPLAQEWVIQLPDSVAAALRTAHELAPAATSIEQLWTSEKTAELCFKQWCDSVPGLSRISSGLLPRLAEQMVFESSCDPVLARLVTAPANSGISGAGAYPSWPSLTVKASITQVLPACNLVNAGADDNGLGSELDPDDVRLAEAFSSARRKIDGLADTAWADFHNHLTGFVAAYLLAATGGRPVRSMFESSSHFDLEGLRVFIEDKASSSGSEGSSARVVPLPAAAARLLKDIYLPHLERLSRDLAEVLPDLGAEVLAQARGEGSSKIPMLFFVSAHDWFDWHEVSEDRLTALGLFQCPLPWNLFRHRLATRLRRHGLDPELIDAQLGHAEAGAQTFCDHSPRCWIEDYPSWARALDAALDDLHVQFPAPRELTPPRLTLEPGYQPWTAQLMGSAARERARRQRRDEARRQARSEIEAAVGKAPPGSVSQEVWADIGRKMLLREDNLPHPYASIRYEVFERYTQDVWSKEGIYVRLKHRRASPPPPARFFSSGMLMASRKLRHLRAALDDAVSVSKPSSTGKRNSGVLAALDLALFGHVADPQLLVSVTGLASQQLKLIVKGRDGYLHHTTEPDEHGERLPLQRFLVPSRSLPFLVQALSAEKKMADDSAPDWLRQASAEAGISATTVEGIVTAVAQIVDQDNCLRLPGLVAGLLAGRVQSYALWTEDWLRAVDGQARISPQVDAVEVATDSEVEMPHHVGGAIPTDDRIKANRQLLSSIRAALNIRKTSEDSDRTSKNAVAQESPLRRKVRSEVRKALDEACAAASPAVHALGSWALQLLSRPSRGKLLDQASIDRYLSAMSSGFLAFAADLDLADLDEDEITDFYQQVIDPALVVDSEVPEEDDSTPQGTLPGGKSRAARKYVLMRLREFHRFAQVHYGLAQPDWSELDQGVTGFLGNPGLITFSEYSDALSCLCGNPEVDPAPAVRRGFVLLLAFRFGLRGGEAISLARSDWVEAAGSVVVLVSGRHRKLKTRGSQRQVPLLGTLTPLEQAVIRRWLEHWQAQSAGDDRVPLFFHEEDHSSVADLAPIRRAIIETLRHFTGNPRTNLHHARHSFGNLAARLVLLPQELDVWPATGGDCLPAPADARRLLLCTDKSTRRAPWAVARLLGHSVLSTTFGSYLHLLHDWAISWVRTLDPDAFGHARPGEFDASLRTDLWERLPDRLRPVLPRADSAADVEVSPLEVLRYLRLRARAVPPRVARLECHIDKQDSEAIEAFLVALARRLALLKGADTEVADKLMIATLLGKIQLHRWDPLEELASTVLVPDPETLARHESLLAMISGNRQLLVWDVSHLDAIDIYLKACRWDWTHVDVYTRPKVHPAIAAALAARGCVAKRTVDPDTGKKTIQIDPAIVEVPGRLPVQTAAQLAVVRGPLTPVLQDNYELIIVWSSMYLASKFVTPPDPAA